MEHLKEVLIYDKNQLISMDDAVKQLKTDKKTIRNSTALVRVLFDTRNGNIIPIHTLN